ncbi:unnamed protein product [Spirodela intermedia]|uniref:ABC1 atypical kinase-like domain-containing protein n=1 Tax=Spirodela intermedia TaxID=51605 RepID=A0A7I8J478_SPIIN|nr:unnamed protein product [Spirodela intermedia]CAA6664171.1 unnamed protein product [Spirodela intermedia]
MSSSPGPTFREKLSIQLEPWHRSLQFWVRVADVYAGYKVCQFRAGLTKDAGERETMWERQHELAADKLYTMCYEMGAAQLVGKPDLAPAAWVRRLVTLCDRAPATPFEVVQKILEEDLGQSFSMMFEKFDEVHRARVRGAKSDVAVKVQHPGVHRLMMTDIHNLQAFALFLQKTEIKFDLFSATKEVEKQVEFEFDFMREADSMEKIHHFLHYKNKKSPVLVPRVFRGLVTRRVLVMDFFDGIPIMNLGAEMARRGINPSGKIAVAAKQSILKSLTQAYGQMILGSGFFHADPHPGNILICKGSEIALLDYGQVKDLPENLRLGYANLVLAMADTDPARISERNVRHQASPGVQVMSPFEDDSSLKTVGVESFPEELFFVLRAIQLLRGLSSGLGINYSCAEQWRPIAEEALRRSGRLKALERRRGFWRRMLRRG